MSACENDLVIAAFSPEAEPGIALRDGLTQVLQGLVNAGCGPHHLTGMVWESRNPAAIHPSRQEIDLAYREVFAGFRPPIRLQASRAEGLHIRATHALPAPPPDLRVQGYTLPELARQYSPRLQTDMKALFAQWTRDGASFRQRHEGLDLAYGPGRFETLDLFNPLGVERAPLWAFLHGGYWQASDKAQHVQFSQGMLDAGFAVAMINYGLAPETPLEDILSQTIASLRFLVREADGLNVDASRLHLAGHSAGGHLAALAACTSDAPPIASALLLSGVFDLAPLGYLPMGRLLGLDDGSRAARLSPLNHTRPPGTRFAAVVGREESDEFKRQAALIAGRWDLPAPQHCAGNHFTLLDGLNGGQLLDIALATAGGRQV